MAMLTAAEPTPQELQAALSEPDALYEIVDGQIIEVPGMSLHAFSIAFRLGLTIKNMAQTANLGCTFIETLFILDADKNLRRRPDIAFVSAERWPLDQSVPIEGDFEIVPDLVIEVVSPNDRGGQIAKKTREYFRYNVRQVWNVFPETREIVIYRSPKKIEVFEEGDILTAEDILPGLKIDLTELFWTTMV